MSPRVRCYTPPPFLFSHSLSSTLPRNPCRSTYPFPPFSCCTNSSLIPSFATYPSQSILLFSNVFNFFAFTGIGPVSNALVLFFGRLVPGLRGLEVVVGVGVEETGVEGSEVEGRSSPAKESGWDSTGASVAGDSVWVGVEEVGFCFQGSADCWREAQMSSIEASCFTSSILNCFSSRALFKSQPYALVALSLWVLTLSPSALSF